MRTEAPQESQNNEQMTNVKERLVATLPNNSLFHFPDWLPRRVAWKSLPTPPLRSSPRLSHLASLSWNRFYEWNWNASLTRDSGTTVRSGMGCARGQIHFRWNRTLFLSFKECHLYQLAQYDFGCWMGMFCGSSTLYSIGWQAV